MNELVKNILRSILMLLLVLIISWLPSVITEYVFDRATSNIEFQIYYTFSSVLWISFGFLFGVITSFDRAGSFSYRRFNFYSLIVICPLLLMSFLFNFYYSNTPMFRGTGNLIFGIVRNMETLRVVQLMTGFLVFNGLYKEKK